MRGLAVIAAASAGWVVVVGIDRPLRFSMPAIDAKAVGLSGLVAAVVMGVAYALLDVAAAAIAMGLILGMVPLAVARRRRRDAETARRDRWPDVLMQVRSSVSAGSTLGDAIISAFSAGGGPFPDMAEIVRREVVFGGGLTAAMFKIRAAENDPTTDRILVALAAAGTSGGARVGEMISVLARSVADEIRLRKAHDAALTEQRLTVNVALFAPWVLLGLSIATNPQAQEAFSSPGGGAVIAIGFAATVFGWLLAMRTSRLKEPSRIFR
jgi:tight adherence protein B